MSSKADHKSTRYVVVSPVRDEEQYIEETIRSMVGQTVRPMQWIIVNDGSTDRTAKIIDRWASEQPWIVAVHRKDRGQAEPSTAGRTANPPKRGDRACEAKEIEAFYEGYGSITAADWAFLVKLDGDLGFDSKYFEQCFMQFDADPKLGIGGGVICHTIDGCLKVEPHPQFHVRGATKIYRRSCWEEMGGVLQGAGWDTVDEVKANMLGWKTRSFQGLRVLHYRFTGAANGAWRNAKKNGAWSYISGYHPLFMFLRCARRVFDRPYVFGSIGLLYGFLLAYVKDIPQIADRKVISYIRHQQLRRMLCRDTIWK
jgi:biofilm PGA synthesis N-glycosyltransferase PgaC